MACSHIRTAVIAVGFTTGSKTAAGSIADCLLLNFVVKIRSPARYTQRELAVSRLVCLGLVCTTLSPLSKDTSLGARLSAGYP